MRALPSFVFAVAAAASGSAFAAEAVGVLAVASPPGPGPELVEITMQLRQAMAARNPAEVLDTRHLRDRMAGQPTGASLAELDRAYEGARAAAVGGDYEGSVKTLRAIVEELEKLPDGEEAFKQWTRAMMRLAKSEADLGRGDASRGILERLLRSAPDAKVDPALYPPRFASQVDEVRAQLKAMPSRRLRVTSPAKEARVFVNGRDVGAVPATVALPPGRYRVSGILGKLAAPAQQVDLGAEDQAVVLDFTMPEALRPDLGPGLALPEADRARRLVAAGNYLGLDGLLATSVVEEGGVSYAVGTLYDVRRGMLKREARVRLANKMIPVGGTTALAEFLLTGEVTSKLVEVPRKIDLKPVAEKPALDLRPGEPGPPGKSRTLGWVAFGSGVAAVGLGGVAIWQGIAAGNSYDSARALLGADGRLPPGQDPTAYNALVRDGDQSRSVAIATGVGAGVCLVGAGILGYLAYKQTGEVGPFRF